MKPVNINLDLKSFFLGALTLSELLLTNSKPAKQPKAELESDHPTISGRYC